MTKKHTARPFLTALLVLISIVAAAALVGLVALLMHIHTLTSRISTLESEKSEVQSNLQAYEAVRCESASTITQEDVLTRYSLEADGSTRTYQVHTPHEYDPKLRYPVIVSFDGIEGSGDRMEAYSGLDALPAIVVYADALIGKEGFTAWQGAPYSLDGDGDVRFVKQLLRTLPSEYCIDTARIFAVGMSNGGNFATIVGCALGDQIKAVASVSGAYYTLCEQEERSPSLLMLHSTADQQVPYEGAPSRNLPAIPSLAEQEAAARKCERQNPTIADTQTISYTWKDCVDSSMLRLIVLNDQPHGWLQVPQTAMDTQTTAEYIWNFFKDSMYYSN